MNKRTLLNMLGFNKDSREAEYQRWLQRQGGGGVPNIVDYQDIIPEAGPAPEEITTDQAGYTQAMERYDWKRRLEDMETNKFYAQLASLFAPQKGSYGRGGSYGPGLRDFKENPSQRYWS